MVEGYVMAAEKFSGFWAGGNLRFSCLKKGQKGECIGEGFSRKPWFLGQTYQDNPRMLCNPRISNQGPPKNTIFEQWRQYDKSSKLWILYSLQQETLHGLLNSSKDFSKNPLQIFKNH